MRKAARMPQEAPKGARTPRRARKAPSAALATPEPREKAIRRRRPVTLAELQRRRVVLKADPNPVLVGLYRSITEHRPIAEVVDRRRSA